MAKIDKMMKDHVSAARKWLGKAETSLDNKNSVRGDLHIMLAEAELKRAREKMENISRPFWRRHIMPLTAGILFFAAGGYWLSGSMDNPAVKINAPAVTTASVANRYEEAAPSEADKKMMPKEMKKTASAEINQQADESVREDRKADNTETKMNYAEVQQKPVLPKAETQVPSKEMQQLMRTAKKTLREQ